MDWRGLTFWEYQALLSGWNEHHSDDAGKEMGPPIDVERMRDVLEAQAGAR